MNNLLAAIMTKCAGSALSTDVGGRIYYDEAPEDAEFPYIVFSITASTPEDTFREDIEDTLVQFSLYSISKGAIEITKMHTDLVALFDSALITVTGGTCINLLRQGMTTVVEDIPTQVGTTGCKHWAVDYSIMVKKT